MYIPHPTVVMVWVGSFFLRFTGLLACLSFFSPRGNECFFFLEVRVCRLVARFYLYMRMSECRRRCCAVQRTRVREKPMEENGVAR